MPNSDSSVADGAVPAPTFVCSHENSGQDAAWVHVAGELDVATTPQLEQALREAESHARLVALDLRDVTLMDSAAVRVIVDASRRARRLGCRLVLLRCTPSVDRAFKLTGDTDAVEIAYVDGRVARSTAPAPLRGGRA